MAEGGPGEPGPGPCHGAGNAVQQRESQQLPGLQGLKTKPKQQRCPEKCHTILARLPHQGSHHRKHLSRRFDLVHSSSPAPRWRTVHRGAASYPGSAQTLLRTPSPLFHACSRVLRANAPSSPGHTPTLHPNEGDHPSQGNKCGRALGLKSVGGNPQNSESTQRVETSSF